MEEAEDLSREEGVVIATAQCSNEEGSVSMLDKFLDQP